MSGAPTGVSPGAHLGRALPFKHERCPARALNIARVEVFNFKTSFGDRVVKSIGSSKAILPDICRYWEARKLVFR